MRKIGNSGISLTFFILLFAIGFLVGASYVSATIENDKIMVPYGYSLCNEAAYSLNLEDKNLTQQYFYRCRNAFMGRSVDNCTLIPDVLPNYNDILTSCHSYKIYQDNLACEKLPLGQDYKDQCYYERKMCTRIVNNDLKETCNREVRNAMIKSRVSTILMVSATILFFLIPIFLLFLLVKTIIDKVKKKRIRWWLRISIALVLIIIWMILIVAVLFISS